MTEPSYDVQIWSVTPYKGKTRITYRVRWTVAGSRMSRNFATRKLAESFRSKLLTAAREGTAFDPETGLPATFESNKPQPVSWYEHAVEFMDMKWAESSPRHRKSTAEALITLTQGLVRPDRPTDFATLRNALRYWAFNPPARSSNKRPPSQYERALTWIARNSLPLPTLAEAHGIRTALASISTNLVGRPVAATTLARKRATLSAALVYAVELGRLHSNPLKNVRTQRRYLAESLDARVVVNPDQARTLLACVEAASPPLHAFFACLYYAALRPSEARNLREVDCLLPASGWGELVLTGSYQESGSAWTDDGARGEERQLKHRNAKETRRVPAPPPLVDALQAHLEKFSTGTGGRLFVTRTGRGGHPIAPPYGNPVSMKTVYRVWAVARARALTAAQASSPLARRPYDLRHACVSTWLTAGVPPTQVATWAGHSVAVLLRVYAQCLDGQDHVARRRIADVLGLDE